MKRWTNRLCRPTRPFSAWETTEISGNFGIRNGEDTVGDINTKFSETERVRENEYTASYAVPVYLQYIKIETNELNRGFDMRDEEEIAEANEDSGFRLTRTPKY
jgi:hypothetical protein